METYLDNAATSHPKPPAVLDAVRRALTEDNANPGRSGHPRALRAAEAVLNARETLAGLLGAQDPFSILFTFNCTDALNLAIKGSLRRGGHVLVSAMEHNAVMRPLVQEGIAFERVPCDREGRLLMGELEKRLSEKPRMLILNHASNVSGTVQDAERIGRLCKQHGVPFVLDAAQSAGHVPVDFEAFSLSALAVPAHKGLLGPQGIGALLVTEEFAAQLSPLIAGGTGSVSDSEELPPYLPDRFESGTPNLPGIYGWSAAMDYVNQTGIETLRHHETALTQRFLDGLRNLRGLRLVGPWETEKRVGVISVSFSSMDNAEASDRLEREFGILTRCGLHCAPAAHRTLGTFPEGTVRFSVGYRTTEAEIDAALTALRALA